MEDVVEYKNNPISRRTRRNTKWRNKEEQGEDKGAFKGVQFINLEERTPPKEFKIRDIENIFGKEPQSHPKGDPKGK